MHSVEASATTRKEAIQNALDELGVEMHDVENIEIVDEGSRGIFGIGARPVRVRVSVAKAPPKKSGEERRPDTRQKDSRQKDTRQKDTRQKDTRQKDTRQKDSRQKEQPRGKAERSVNAEAKPSRDKRDDEQAKDGNGAQEKEGGAEGQRRPRRSRSVRRPKRGSRNNGEQAAAASQPEKRDQEAVSASGNRGSGSQERPRRDRDAAPQQMYPEQARERAEDIEVTPLSEEQGREAAALMQEIINKMGMEAKVDYRRTDDDTARLDIASEDSALLIGRKGRNLQAMQYIINRMVSREEDADLTERLVTDIEGYVDRRKASLEDMAQNMAEKAKQTGRDMRLKPMSPQERRIVHLTLRDDEEVRTFSLGESLYRTIVISPKNKQDSARGTGGGSNRGGRGRGRGGRGRRGGRARGSGSGSGSGENQQGAAAPSENKESGGEEA